MTKKEVIEKNIGMTFDFLRYLADHPELVDDIPNSAVIEFVDKEIAVKETISKTRKGKAVSFRVERAFKPIKPASQPGHAAL